MAHETLTVWLRRSKVKQEKKEEINSKRWKVEFATVHSVHRTKKLALFIIFIEPKNNSEFNSSVFKWKIKTKNNKMGAKQ